MSVFPCTKCGVCCSHLDRIAAIFLSDDPADPFYFPYDWDVTGRCENLTADNMCRVYENRPLACNLEKLREHLGIEEKEFYKLNATSCNRLQQEAGIPESYRVNY